MKKSLAASIKRVPTLFKTLLQIAVFSVVLAANCWAGQGETTAEMISNYTAGRYPELMQQINTAVARSDDDYLISANLGMIWARLAEKYPPARGTLDDYRERYSQTLSRGHFNEYQLKLILAANKQLDQNYLSVDLLRKIDQHSPHRDGSLFGSVAEILMNEGEYRLARRYLGNAEKSFTQDLKTALMFKNDDKYGFAKLSIESSIRIIIILDNTGAKKDAQLARKLQKQLVAAWDGPEIEEALAKLTGQGSGVGQSFTVAAGGNCPSNFHHLSGDLPPFHDPALSEIRQGILATSMAQSGSRYFCESLFWASQPKQAAKT